MGVFLDESQPDLSSAPASLDFRSTGNVAGGVNYASLSPALRQVFFIGDGLGSSATTQTVAVPTGATRLFLGTMDGFGWYNNFGSFEVHVTAGIDTDGDGVFDDDDNCPIPNRDQRDEDENGIGDVCDQLVEFLVLDHTHTYLTGKGKGHNNTEAETGPAEPPME